MCCSWEKPLCCRVLEGPWFTGGTEEIEGGCCQQLSCPGKSGHLRDNVLLNILTEPLKPYQHRAVAQRLTLEPDSFGPGLEGPVHSVRSEHACLL